MKICNSYEDIYCFGDKLVGIDKNVYDRVNRFNLQKQFNVYPYFVSQNVFKEILNALVYGKVDMKLIDINFIDDSIIETEEHKYLQDVINKNDIIDLYKQTLNIIEQFDTEIKNIKFIYNYTIIELTNTGVLNLHSKDELLNNLFFDTKIKDLLLGKC
jgi:hypothetical protein